MPNRHPSSDLEVSVIEKRVTGDLSLLQVRNNNPGIFTHL